MVYITHKTYDIAFLNTQTQIAGIDFPEFHELVNQLSQSSYTSFGCLDRFLLGVALFIKLINSSLDYSQWCTELMSHLSKEAGTELRYLFVNLHLLVQFKFPTLMTIYNTTYTTNQRKIYYPCPP